jgi:GNAT superfamily N-acetyltransferase
MVCVAGLEIRVAGRADAAETAQMLARAFHDDPVRQGHGVGAALLRARLRRCDQERLPAYLESSKLENVPLYQHFGFHVTGTLGLPEGAPAVNTMWRPGDLKDDAG